MVKADIVPVGLSGLESYSWNIFKRPVVNLKMGTPISYKLDEEEIIETQEIEVEEEPKVEEPPKLPTFMREKIEKD